MSDIFSDIIYLLDKYEQFSKNIKKLITVSKIVKEDYIKNGKIDKDKVCYVYPACEKTDKIPPTLRNEFYRFNAYRGNFDRLVYSVYRCVAAFKYQNTVVACDCRNRL